MTKCTVFSFHCLWTSYSSICHSRKCLEGHHAQVRSISLLLRQIIERIGFVARFSFVQVNPWTFYNDNWWICGSFWLSNFRRHFLWRTTRFFYALTRSLRCPKSWIWSFLDWLQGGSSLRHSCELARGISRTNLPNGMFLDWSAVCHRLGQLIRRKIYVIPSYWLLLVLLIIRSRVSWQISLWLNAWWLWLVTRPSACILSHWHSYSGCYGRLLLSKYMYRSVIVRFNLPHLDYFKGSTALLLFHRLIWALERWGLHLRINLTALFAASSLISSASRVTGRC